MKLCATTAWVLSMVRKLARFSAPKGKKVHCAAGVEPVLPQSLEVWVESRETTAS